MLKSMSSVSLYSTLSGVCKTFIRSREIFIRHSSYGPHFIEPIYRREDLKAAKESGEDQKLSHIPIKAARSEQTCSLFHDPLIEKFINYAMRCGKKELARSQIDQAFETVKRIQVEKYHREKDPEVKSTIEIDPLKVFYAAVDNCKPVLQLTPIKRGGATYQVPVPISQKRALFLAMNWLIENGKGEPRTTRFYVKLANELISASKNQGKSVKRKQDLHRQCEANRAYAHYRWG